MFSTQSDNCIIFLTSNLHLLLNWKSLKLAYHLKDYMIHFSCFRMAQLLAQSAGSGSSISSSSSSTVSIIHNTNVYFRIHKGGGEKEELSGKLIKFRNIGHLAFFVFVKNSLIILAPYEGVTIFLFGSATEAAILFAGSRLAPPKISSSLGLFVSHDRTLLY